MLINNDIATSFPLKKITHNIFVFLYTLSFIFNLIIYRNYIIVKERKNVSIELIEILI